MPRRLLELIRWEDNSSPFAKSCVYCGNMGRRIPETGTSVRAHSSHHGRAPQGDVAVWVHMSGSSLIDMGERRSADVSRHEAQRAGPTSEDARRRISDLGLAVNCACVARRRGGCALRRV
jgi:hypothetical protein